MKNTNPKRGPMVRLGAIPDVLKGVKRRRGNRCFRAGKKKTGRNFRNLQG